jgi:hypothetical protein
VIDMGDDREVADLTLRAGGHAGRGLGAVARRSKAAPLATRADIGVENSAFGSRALCSSTAKAVE